MKKLVLLAMFIVIIGAGFARGQRAKMLANPSIDIAGYLRMAAKAAEYRETRRLTEDEFIQMAAKTGAVILDARSTEKFNELHIKGALNLSFPDITVESLGRLLPDKNTLILIYCNNNFSGAEQPFPTKIPASALNISTYISLYTYGYRNVYELGPLLDIEKTKLQLVRLPTALATR